MTSKSSSFIYEVKTKHKRAAAAKLSAKLHIYTSTCGASPTTECMLLAEDDNKMTASATKTRVGRQINCQCNCLAVTYMRDKRRHGGLESVQLYDDVR